MLLAVAVLYVFRLWRKVSHAFLLRLLTLGTFYRTRARLTLEPSRLLCVLRFAFFLPPKANRKARRNFPPPRLWLKSGKCP